VLKASKYISDLTKQTSRVGELRGAIQAGVMTEQDVYAELGELVNGKPGRVGDELIVVDLTGTGAQDAAIGQASECNCKERTYERTNGKGLLQGHPIRVCSLARQSVCVLCMCL
jgi:ornithine cyclodeaminase/alanine dehydrogenase-like protein (mu-crystallin family)